MGYQIIGLLGWITTLGLIYAMSYVPLQPDAPLSVATSLFPLSKRRARRPNRTPYRKRTMPPPLLLMKTTGV